MSWFPVAVSQFTKRLESYGRITTDHICCSASTAPINCGCGCSSWHERVASGDDQCRANVGDCLFELRRDRTLQETVKQTFKDVATIKVSTSSGIAQG